MKQSSLLAVLVVGTMHFLFFSPLTTTFECHSQFWQKQRQQCLFFSSRIYIIISLFAPFSVQLIRLQCLSVWKLLTGVVPFLSHFSVVGCQLSSRRHLLAFSLPPPNKLHVNIINFHPRPCYTQQSTNISVIIFASDTWSPRQAFVSHVSLNSLLCGKLLDSKTVLCHNHPLPASYRVLV